MDVTITTLIMIVQISLMFAAVFFTLKALSLIHHGKLTGSGGATVALSGSFLPHHSECSDDGYILHFRCHSIHCFAALG